GMSNMLEGFVKNEPLPVNLAFMWNQSISKVPLVNKALAAPNDRYKNLPVLEASYGMWKFSRNVALGLIALVLLYTGIMIIMRKKINPQVVVSVQYAIPKIIIGLLLILFSYAIGAAITAISWGLFRGADSLFFNSVLQAGGTIIPTNVVMLAIAMELITLTGGSTFLMLLVFISILILVVLKLVLWFKVILIYVKMVFSIFTAPFEFAIGTVPGSEARIMDWFKRMAKYMITIFAIGLVVPITLFLAMGVVYAYGTTGGVEFGGMGGIMAILGPMIIIIMGFSLGLGMEGRIDSMFFGVKGKKR
ncbi:hypothetical protein K0B04_01690, partial [Patescibacteria group bacterium]|nr:hypothetical protein [Patescibacteria group bacterium]